MSEEKGLAAGSLGTFESAIVGIAGTAPAFSRAVTTAAIVAVAGTLSVVVYVLWLNYVWHHASFCALK